MFNKLIFFIYKLFMLKLYYIKLLLCFYYHIVYIFNLKKAIQNGEFALLTANKPFFKFMFNTRSYAAGEL